MRRELMIDYTRLSFYRLWKEAQCLDLGFPLPGCSFVVLRINEVSPEISIRHLSYISRSPVAVEIPMRTTSTCVAEATR